MKRWILDLSLAKMYRANGLSLQINNDWNKIHSSTIPICKVALTCMTKTWSDDNDRERKTDQPRKKTLSYVYNNIVLPYYGLVIHFSDTWPGVQVPVFRKSRLLYGPSAILSNLTLGSSRAKKSLRRYINSASFRDISIVQVWPLSAAVTMATFERQTSTL